MVQVDIPEDMIIAVITAGGDTSFYLHIAHEVLRQAREERPDLFEEYENYED